MDINLTASFTGITNDLRVVYYETTAPTAPVGIYDLPAPHPASRQWTKNVANAVPHIVKIFDWNGSVLGQIRIDFFVDPAYTTNALQPDLHLLVDGGNAGDPATGDIVLTNTIFQNFDIHHIHRDGVLFEDWAQDTVAGTATNTDPANVYNSGERIVVSFLPKISVASPVNVVNSLILGIINVAADYTVDVADAGSLLAVAAGASSIEITMPLISTIPENKMFPVQVTGGSQKIAKVISDPVASIIYNGQVLDYLFLTMGEGVWLLKNGLYLYAISGNVDYNKVGSVTYGHKIAANQLLLDGSEISRVEYARLWELIQGDAIAEATKITTQVVNGQTIYPYKGCYGDGDGVDTFTLPNLMNDFIRALKTVGGSDSERTQNIPGGFQGFQGQDHSHQYPISVSGSGVGGLVHSNGGTAGYNSAGKVELPKKYDLSAGSFGIETRAQNIGLLPVVNF